MAKKAVEQTGLIPRSIIRTFDRFRKQLFPEAENLIIQEFRISRYQFLVSIKCLASLIFIPLIVNYLLKNFLLIPLTETFWNNKQSEIFLNAYQQEQAFNELKNFQEKLYFEYLLNNQMNFPLKKNQSFGEKYIKKNLLQLDVVYCSDISRNISYFFHSQQQHTQCELKTTRGLVKSIFILPKSETSSVCIPISVTTSTNTLNIKKKILPISLQPNLSKKCKVSLISKQIQNLNKICLIKLKKNKISNHQLFNVIQFKSKKRNNNTMLLKKLEPNLVYKDATNNIWVVDDELFLFFHLNLSFNKINSIVLNLDQQITEDALKKLIKNKIVELAVYYNHQSILALTNLIGDFITFLVFSLVIMYMKPQISILKSFLTESIYSLNDTKKSFLLILGTDLLVGFHSPRGWEICLELVLRHFGFPENKDFVFLFVASFPVLLDTVFKYWIFRYLNKISPSTVATYHNMIE